MRIASVVEPSDDDETLVYELPTYEVEELSLFPTATATAAHQRTPARSRLSEAPMAMTVIAALIGAMVAAWSIEERAVDGDLVAELFVSGLAQLWPVDTGGGVAPVRSDASSPPRVQRAAALMPSAPAAEPKAEVPASGAPSAARR